MMVNQILLVSAGGIVGSILRFIIGQHFNNNSFPYGTLIVNLIGSLFLGFILGFCTSKYWTLLLATGFSGAFTTFSTFNWDILQFLQHGQFTKATSYLGISIGLGLLLIYTGYSLSIVVRN